MAELNCAVFEHRHSFADFIALLNTTTNGNLSLAAGCAPQICQALWGTGNPDISGVGMAVGYITSNLFEFAFPLLCLYSHSGRRWWPASRPQLCRSMADSCHEAALFFAFSVEIACVVVLTRATFGLNADGMGDLTVRITWTVAILCILPLVYRTFLADDPRERQATTTATTMTADRRKRSSARSSFSFPLFTICWAVFLYTFLNRMASTFGPSQIGSGPDAVISSQDWTTVQSICTVDWGNISPPVDSAINAFGIATSLLISALTLTRLFHEILRAWGISYFDTNKRRYFSRIWNIARVVLWVVFPILAVGLVWSFFALQTSQKQLADAIGDDDPDEDWSFGQIVSMALFAPVLLELIEGVFSDESR